MQLAEFTCSWSGNYTKEQEQTYRITCGEDQSNWPPTDDETPIVIDLDRVCEFNPHHDEGKTTVEIAGGMRYALVIQYQAFKDIMADITKCGFVLDYKTPKINAIPNRNK